MTSSDDGQPDDRKSERRRKDDTPEPDYSAGLPLLWMLPAAMGSARAVFWGAIALSVLTVVGTMWFLVDPAPPTRVTIATGVEGGFYDRLGRRYAVALQRSGVEVELVPTAGSGENIGLLRGSDDIDATFVQGGVGSPPPQDTSLRSLGSLGIEPVWIFAREAQALSDLDDRPLRVAMGPEGSGTRDFMTRLFSVTGLDKTIIPVDLDGEEAAQAVIEGDVDVATFVTSPLTTWVRSLIANPEVHLVDVREADALTRLIPFATRVFLPARVIDYPKRIPPHDVTILGVATILMVREALHPAIKQLLLQVSSNVARGDAILGTLGEFPSSRLVEYPLDAEAERYFRYGPSPARLYLPFWAANLVERFWVLVIPVATLLIPILRFGPSTLEWSLRRRVYRWYKDLRELEVAAEAAKTGREKRKVLASLRGLEEQVSDIRVPLAFRDDVYRLRTHIAFVRSELADVGD